jgi:hypothetical protein
LPSSTKDEDDSDDDDFDEEDEEERKQKQYLDENDYKIWRETRKRSTL